MAAALDAKELRALQHLHKVMLTLETGVRDSAQPLSESDLKPVCDAVLALPESDRLEIQKLRELTKHLQPRMTLKQFSMWIIPVERALGRELRDDQFLIFTKDKNSASSAAAAAAATLPAKLPLVFILDNLRSAFNVGSIFRTAECFGVEKIYLTGYTPSPDQEKIAKTAMGTDALVQWEHIPKISELLQKLSLEGHNIVAFETTSHAVDLQNDFPSQPTAFVFGNERFGLEGALLELCHEVRKIPLQGQKNSLNVGVATAIATYEFSRQWNAHENVHLGQASE